MALSYIEKAHQWGKRKNLVMTKVGNMAVVAHYFNNVS